VINEAEGPYEAYNGVGKWKCLRHQFRAAHLPMASCRKGDGDDLFQWRESAHYHKIMQVAGARIPESTAAGGGKGIPPTCPAA